MNRAATGDRAPVLAAIAVAVTMAAVVAFWALFALVGGNGFSGDAGLAWLLGNIGAALLAWVVAPWWTARRCARWRRGGWSTGSAIVASTLLALGGVALALSAVALATAGIAGSMR